MRFSSKYSIGDTVVGIEHRHEESYVPCENCGGHGSATTPDGHVLLCGEYRCSGGRVRVTLPKSWQIAHRLIVGTIGQIRAEVTDEGTAVTYMCHETGVGSGQNWRESLLYRTAAEAQAECDRRNQAGEAEGRKR